MHKIVTAAAGGLVVGWTVGLVLVVLVRWVSEEVFDRPVVLRGLELVLGVTGAIAAGVLAARAGTDRRTPR